MAANREGVVFPLVAGAALVTAGLMMGDTTGSEHFDKAEAAKTVQLEAEAQRGYGVLDGNPTDFFKDTQPMGSPTDINYDQIAKDAFGERVKEDALGVLNVGLNGLGVLSLLYGGLTGYRRFRYFAGYSSGQGWRMVQDLIPDDDTDRVNFPRPGSGLECAIEDWEDRGSRPRRPGPFARRPRPSDDDEGDRGGPGPDPDDEPFRYRRPDPDDYL